MKAQQPATSRGLSGEDRSFRDSYVNLALRDAFAELKADSSVVSSPDDDPPLPEAVAMSTEVADAVPTSTTPVANSALVEETPREESAAAEGEVSPPAERRSPFHAVTREHVASAQVQPEARSVEPEGDVPEQVHFTVAPILPRELGQRPTKPKPLPKDAPWERVTLGAFQKNKNAELLSLVRSIRAKGFRPVMTMEIRAPDGAGTQVNFGLSIAVEKGGYEHVKLVPLGGAGLFGWLFQGGVEVFHDEVMGEKPAHPDRYLATVGVNAAVNMVASFLASRRAVRQQR